MVDDEKGLGKGEWPRALGGMEGALSSSCNMVGPLQGFEQMGDRM